MVPTNKVTPTGDNQDSQKDVTKTEASNRPISPTVDERGRGRPFREVLNNKLSQKDDKKAATTVSNSDEQDEDVVSPFELASFKPVRKVLLSGNAPDLLDETPDAELLPTKEKKIFPGEMTTTVAVGEEGEIEPKGKAVGLVGEESVTLTTEAPITPKMGTGKAHKKEADLTFVTDLPEGEKSKVVASFVPVTTKDKPVTGSVTEEDEVLDPKTGIKKGDDTVSKTADGLAPITSKKDPGLREGDIASSDEEVVGTVSVTPKKKTEDLPKTRDVDIPQINLAAGQLPDVGAPAAVVATQAPNEPAKAREVLIKLAAQMVEKLEKITTPEKVDTTLRLQYPPIFNGTDITITEYTTSQKQFNLTFSHLGVEARLLVEQLKNQDSLRAALMDKGYTLQTIVLEEKIPGLQSTESLEVATEEHRTLDKGNDMNEEEDKGSVA